MLPAQASQLSVPSLLVWNPEFNEYAGETNKLICEKVNNKMFQDFRYTQGFRVPPWESMPPEAKRYQRSDNIPFSDIVVDTDTVVLEMVVPTGWDGVISTVVNIFSPTGIVEGSGDVQWSIAADKSYLRDYGAIHVQLGDLSTPYAIEGGWIRVYSEQTIYYRVQVNAAGMAALDPDGRFICALSGWWWPRRELKS